MDLGCGSEDSDGKVKRGGGVGGKDELCDEGEESGGSCANLKNEFTETGDVDLCDIKEFLMCLFE